MRMIDADALIDDIMTSRESFVGTHYEVQIHDDECDYAIEQVETAKTIDNVRHGHWVDRNRFGFGIGMSCSACDYTVWTRGEFDDAKRDEMTNYCPHCGADMRENPTRRSER